MIYFTAHTFDCVSHSIRTIFRVLGVYNFGFRFTVHKEKDKFVKKIVEIQDS